MNDLSVALHNIEELQRRLVGIQTETAGTELSSKPDIYDLTTPVIRTEPDTIYVFKLQNY